MADIKVTEFDRREFNRIRDKVDGMRGVLVNNSRTTISIKPPPVPPRQVSVSPAAKLPQGQYQEMVCKMVSDGQVGYGYVLAHAM